MKSVFLLLTMLFSYSLLAAQQAPDFTLRINHVAVPVSDLGQSARFYGDVLQLREITSRTAQGDIRSFSLGGATELHLILTKQNAKQTNKAIHFALSTANFKAFAEALGKKGIAYSDWEGNAQAVSRRSDGVQQLYLQDPDGHWIEVNDATEVSTITALKLDNLLQASLTNTDSLEVIVSYLEVPKNTSLPMHYHPGEEFAFMISGSGEVLFEGKEPQAAKAGDVAKIPLEQVHSFQTLDESATLVVFRVHRVGKPERILVK